MFTETKHLEDTLCIINPQIIGFPQITTVAWMCTSRYDGGGIYSLGNLTMLHCNVYDNVVAGRAGGVYSRGNLTMLHCNVYRNEADDAYRYVGLGGGVFIYGGNATLRGCNIYQNYAVTGGGFYMRGWI